MNDDIISYRYAKNELSALMLILQLPSLPGAALPQIDEPAYRAAIDSLSDSGIVTPAGDRVIVDKLSAVLLVSIAKCRFFLRFAAPDRTVVLWRCARLCVLGAFPEKGECSLTPLQTLDHCGAPLESALARCGFPIAAESPLLKDEAPAAANADELKALAARLMALAREADRA